MQKKEFHLAQIDNVSLSNAGFVIFLKKQDDKRVLPIFIGTIEAHSIAAALNQQDFPRPLSHDLLKNILEHVDTSILRIHVTELKDSTFYARIYLRGPSGEFDVDSRPSDAMALALRYHAPIFVQHEVFEQAAIMLEDEEAKEQEDPLSQLQEDMEKAVTEERYEDAAVLRDKIKKLTTDN